MKLATLIRTGVLAGFANANAAKPANDAGNPDSSLAALATFALANSKDVNPVQWQEFERLLVIVAQAYKTPAHEYAEMRKAAMHDLDAALTTYRSIAKQLKGF